MQLTCETRGPRQNSRKHHSPRSGRVSTRGIWSGMGGRGETGVLQTGGGAGTGTREVGSRRRGTSELSEGPPSSQGPEASLAHASPAQSLSLFLILHVGLLRCCSIFFSPYISPHFVTTLHTVVFPSSISSPSLFPEPLASQGVLSMRFA